MQEQQGSKCTRKKNIMFAYGLIQLGSGVISAVALILIALGLCSIKQESKYFNQCVTDIVKTGTTNSDAVRYCNGG